MIPAALPAAHARTAVPLPAAVPTSAGCKCCGAGARLAGFVDFARDCYGLNAREGVVSGIALPYYRCERCEFAFTDAFDDWTPEHFRAHVYNAEYLRYDPRFAEARPRKIAALVQRLLPERSLRVLDHGGGNGRLAELLRETGYATVASYDPFHHQPQPPEETGFDLVACIEVAEHTTQPLALFAELHRRVAPDGVILLSTRDMAEAQGRWVDDWYVAPRNGHVSFYTSRTLALLAQSIGRRHHKIDTYRHLLLPGA